jgi:hypothetical protein
MQRIRRSIYDINRASVKERGRDLPGMEKTGAIMPVNILITQSIHAWDGENRINIRKRSNLKIYKT